MATIKDDTAERVYLPLIDRAIASKRWLTPMPAVFQPRYAAEQFATRRAGNRRVIIIMTIIFDLFLLAQFRSAPEILRASAVLRLGAVTPVALAFVLLDMNGRLRRFYGLFLVTAAALPTIVSAVLILMTDPQNTTALSDIHATPLILLASGVVARLTPRELFANVVISVVCFCGAVSLAAFVPVAQLGSLLLTDLAIGTAAIDDFKSFNDVYGHLGGDECLRLIAARARAEVRTSDLFARYGGEEFAAILPGARLETAVAIAERIRLAVQDLDLRHGGQGEGARVSVSLGVAAMEPKAADDMRLLVEMADAHLYAAKRCGRNQVRWQAGADAPSAVRFGAAVLDFKPDAC
jgi:diguanylate cyclase (GGDEF)-like protein